MTNPEPPPGIDSSRLSTRERNILALLAFGQDHKNIAQILGISISTVSRTLRGLRGFLHCRNSAYLVVRAIELGLMGKIDNPKVLSSPGAFTFQRIEGILGEEGKGLTPFEAAYLASAVPHHSASMRNQWVSREPIPAAAHLFNRLNIDYRAVPEEFLLVIAVAVRLRQVQVVQEPIYQHTIEVQPGFWLTASGVPGSKLTVKHRGTELFFEVPEDDEPDTGGSLYPPRNHPYYART